MDPTLWKLELERVAPKLHITLAADARDWRQHLDAAHTHQTGIAGAWPDAQKQLQRMAGDVSNALEKVESRERYLNEQYEHLMRQYQAIREQLTSAQEEYHKYVQLAVQRCMASSFYDMTY